MADSITIDGSWFMEQIHNLPATGTPHVIGRCIGEGIVEALAEKGLMIAPAPCPDCAKLRAENAGLKRVLRELVAGRSEIEMIHDEAYQFVFTSPWAEKWEEARHLASMEGK